MLVLALQFSKGIAGRRDRATARSTGPPWQRSLERLVPGERVGAPHEEEGRLPQNGREDKDDRDEIEGSETYDLRARATYPPVHQLGTGSNRAGRMPAID